MKNILYVIFFVLYINCFSQIVDSNYISKYYTEITDTRDPIDGKIVLKYDKKTYALSDYILGNPINAKFFGVKADGKSDDTKSLQLAIDFCSNKGLILFLPTGKMVTLADLNVTLNKLVTTKFRIIGNGISNSIILNKGENTKIALNIVGNYYDMFSMKDFSIERIDTGTPTGGVGIKLNKLVYSTFENIDVFRFNTGIILNDVSSSSFKNVNARWGQNGMLLTLEPNGMSNPNLLEFRSCIFNSNNDWGIKINNAHNVNFYSCLFEDNGKGGIFSTYNNSNGAVSINVRDSYFEGNSGYDIHLISKGQGSHNFSGNTFNRVSNNKFTENNILIELNQTIPESFENIVNLVGNGFFYGNTYKPTSKRKNINIISNGKKVKLTDNDSYRNEIEK